MVRSAWNEDEVPDLTDIDEDELEFEDWLK